MKHRTSTWAGMFLFAGSVLFSGSPSHAQSGYYGRTSSTVGAVGPSRTALQGRSTGRATQDAVSTTSDDEPDPLQHYGSATAGRDRQVGRVGLETRMATPQPQSARPVRRDYFAGMRSGRSPNRNVPTFGRPHCVPGRGQMFASRR